MATTFIDYKEDKGFWVVEDVMELVFQYIYKELKSGKYTFSKIDGLLLDAEHIINGFVRGWLVLMWDEDIQEEQEMIRLLEKIVLDLEQKGEYISVEELQTFPSKAEDWKNFWNKPFKTQNLLNIFDAMIKMLKGEWESSNYAMDIDWT